MLEFCYYCGSKATEQKNGKWVCPKHLDVTFMGYKGDPPDYYVEAHASKKSQELSKKYIQDASEIKENKLLAELGQFFGTETWWKHAFGLTYTDGIKYLAKEASAYWLIDLVASYYNKYKAIPFQLWRITVKDDDTAVVSMQEDTGKPYLIEQEIPYTDFPLKDFSWYVCDGVMLLKSEY